jgi:hypothetical protein
LRDLAVWRDTCSSGHAQMRIDGLGMSFTHTMRTHTEKVYHQSSDKKKQL